MLAETAEPTCFPSAPIECSRTPKRFIRPDAERPLNKKGLTLL